MLTKPPAYMEFSCDKDVGEDCEESECQTMKFRFILQAVIQSLWAGTNKIITSSRNMLPVAGDWMQWREIMMLKEDKVSSQRNGRSNGAGDTINKSESSWRDFIQYFIKYWLHSLCARHWNTAVSKTDKRFLFLVKEEGLCCSFSMCSFPLLDYQLCENRCHVWFTFDPSNLG